MSIPAKLVFELRKATGAGMMDCKKALQETESDFDKAVEYLQIKKKATAAKKSTRIAAEGIVGSYIHMGGKIGVICEVNIETDFAAKNEMFTGFVQDICMHIAALGPKYVTSDEIPAEEIERQKRIFIAQVVEEGKPEAIAEKIVAGKINKWMKQDSLLDQKFVKDDKKTVREYQTAITGDIGEKISIRRFVRFELGEGLAKREENFAEEVAKQMGKG
ncbi:MAG: elongation factor Ts [Myxococcota bacterium]|jgi:elongation factor Ts